MNWILMQIVHDMKFSHSARLIFTINGTLLSEIPYWHFGFLNALTFFWGKIRMFGLRLQVNRLYRYKNPILLMNFCSITRQADGVPCLCSHKQQRTFKQVKY